MLKSIHKTLLLATVILMASCNGSDEPSTEDNNKDRQAILIHWVDNIVKPSYQNFGVSIDNMIAKADAFTASPDAQTLLEFRSAWESAYIEWQKVELFEFGGADQYGLRNFLNIYPASVPQITNNINDPSVNLDVPAAYSSQGFPALDYLINGVAANDEAIIQAYTTDGDASKRIAYLKRITERMGTLTENVINVWNGNYRDTFINKPGLDIGSSMGNVVNAYVLEYERYIRTGKVGIPAGVFSSGIVQPDKVEAYYKKDISKVLAVTANRAAQDFFNGKHANSNETGPSFKSYLDALGAKDAASGEMLSSTINNQFGKIQTELNGLSENFVEQIADNNDAMTDAYAEMQKMVRLLKLDMTSAMSITITYTDNDGD